MNENKASYCSERDSNPGQLDWEDRGQRIHLAMLPAPLLSQTVPHSKFILRLKSLNGTVLA